MYQGTLKWHRERYGKITASRVIDVIKGGKTYESYLRELAAERLLKEGQYLPAVCGKPLEWGHEYEPEARKFYERKFDVYVEEVGFKAWDKNPSIGASSDGLVKKGVFDDKVIKIIEIKCPYTPKNHIGNMLDDIDKQHYAQMQLNMLVWDVDTCDYVSYCPLLVNELYVREVKADKEYQAIMIEKCEKFLIDLDNLVNKVK